MGAVLLVLAYGLTVLALWGLVAAGDRRPSPAAVLVLALLPLVYTASGFLPGKTLAPTAALAGLSPWAQADLAELMESGSSDRNPLLFDALTQFLPWRAAARHDLLFNPAQGGGAALLGNGQSAALFPPEVVARFMPPVRGETYLGAARIAVAVWGLFLLARALGVSELSSLVAAAAFSGVGFLQLWRAHPHTYILALMPWVIWALIELARAPGPRKAAALAVAGAVAFLGGHPETLLQGMVFALAVALPMAWGRTRGHIPRVVGWGALAALLAFLLAAPALLPFVENLRASAEWAVRGTGSHDAVEWPLYGAVVRLIPAVFHLGLGDPIAGTWWGPENLLELAGGSTGAAVLILLPAALAWRTHRKVAVLWLGVGLLGLLVGAHFPILSKPFGWVPLLRESLLKRLVFWWAIAAPVLAGMGLDAVLAGRARRRVWGGAGGVAVALGTVLAFYPDSRDLAALMPELVGLTLGLGALAWIARSRERDGRSVVPGVALLLLAVIGPRLWLFDGWIPRVSAYSYYPRTEAVEFLVENSPGYRIAGIDAALVPHSAAFFGLEEVRGYDPMALAGVERFAAAYGKKTNVGWHRIFDPARPALDFLGVRYLVDHPKAGERGGAVRVFAGHDAVVFENPDVLPRVFVPQRFQVFADAEAALEAAISFDNFARDASLSGDGLTPSDWRDNDFGRVENLEVGREGRISASVTADAEILVATSQPAIPGWRLEMDGKRHPVVAVNGPFLGALVPAGSHRLEWVYAPRSWTVGLFLAALGAAALVACWLAGRPRPGEERA